MAHTGFPGYSDTWREIKKRKNVFVDLSQTSYVGPRTLRAAVEYLGADRCLFGTDGPYGFHGPDGTIDYGPHKAEDRGRLPRRGDKAAAPGR